MLGSKHLHKKQINRKIKGKYREPKAKHAWPGSKKFGKKRYELKTVSIKKPKKSELENMRRNENVRVVSDRPRYGHRVNIATGPVVGKHAIYTSPKGVQKKRRRKRR